MLSDPKRGMYRRYPDGTLEKLLDRLQTGGAIYLDSTGRYVAYGYPLGWEGDWLTNYGVGLYDLETNEARLHTLGSVTVKNNCFAGNAYYGLYNRRTDMTLDATLNWWGDPSGPRPLGTGDYDYAPTNLAVSPWLVYDPTLAPPEVTLAVSPDPFSICLTLTATVESPDGVKPWTSTPTVTILQGHSRPSRIHANGLPGFTLTSRITTSTRLGRES